MSRRGWWLAGGVAALVVIGAGLWIWQSTNRPPTAEEAATSYLRALESGDPSMVAATGVAASSTALDAFAGATKLIEDAEVTSAPVDHDGTEKATVEVSFRLDGEKHTAELSLMPIDGRWTVDASGLGTTTATTTIGSFVSIGEAFLPVGEPAALLPAEYTAAVAPSSLLDGRSTLRVLPGERSALAVEASLRPEATTTAQQQLDDQLGACTAPGSAPPEHCGIRIPWGTEFRAVSEYRYRVEQLPTIVLDGTGFRADEGVLVSTLTGTGQDGTERTTTYRTDSWSVRGEISFTADDLVVTVW